MSTSTKLQCTNKSNKKKAPQSKSEEQKKKQNLQTGFDFGASNVSRLLNQTSAGSLSRLDVVTVGSLIGLGVGLGRFVGSELARLSSVPHDDPNPDPDSSTWFRE